MKKYIFAAFSSCALMVMTSANGLGYNNKTISQHFVETESLYTSTAGKKGGGRRSVDIMTGLAVTGVLQVMGVMAHVSEQMLNVQIDRDVRTHDVFRDKGGASGIGLKVSSGNFVSMFNGWVKGDIQQTLDGFVNTAHIEFGHSKEITPVSNPNPGTIGNDHHNMIDILYNKHKIGVVNEGRCAECSIFMRYLNSFERDDNSLKSVFRGWSNGERTYSASMENGFANAIKVAREQLKYTFVLVKMVGNRAERGRADKKYGVPFPMSHCKACNNASKKLGTFDLALFLEQDDKRAGKALSKKEKRKIRNNIAIDVVRSILAL